MKNVRGATLPAPEILLPAQRFIIAQHFLALARDLDTLAGACKNIEIATMTWEIAEAFRAKGVAYRGADDGLAPMTER